MKTDERMYKWKNEWDKIEKVDKKITESDFYKIKSYRILTFPTLIRRLSKREPSVFNIV